MQPEMSENVALTTWKHSNCMRLLTAASDDWCNKCEFPQLSQEVSTFAQSHYSVRLLKCCAPVAALEPRQAVPRASRLLQG